MPLGGHHPGVLGAAALAGVHHERPLGQRHPGQAAGQQPDIVAVVDRERPQVDVAGLQPFPDQHRRCRQAHRPLRDPAARVGRHHAVQFGQRLLVGVRPDDDALAAGPVHRLEHEMAQLAEDPGAHVRIVQPVGLDVGEHRLLVEVVADQVGHVGVDELVVSHAVADPVGDRHVPGPCGVDETGAADDRIGPEQHRVQEIVVDAAVDHVDQAPPVGGAQVDAVARAEQVASLDEFGTHEPGQQGVLEVGRIVDARRKDDDHRIVGGLRGGGAERGQQARRVFVHRGHPLLGEQRRGMSASWPAGSRSRS